MSLARTFNRTLHGQLNTYAAWLPVTNTFQIGDFGLIEGGVFKSVGNIANKYPDINMDIKSGPPAKINFKSEGTKVFKIGADGEVDSFSALGNAEAKLKFQFEKEDSIVVKSTLTSQELKNIEDVALNLISKSSWKKKYKVVCKTYEGDKCVVICSKQAGTEVTLEAKANILKEVEAGKVDGSVHFSSSRNGVFESIGESGVIGLDLFKIGLFNNVKLLADMNPDDIKVEKDLGVDLEDDF